MSMNFNVNSNVVKCITIVYLYSKILWVSAMDVVCLFDL